VIAGYTFGFSNPDLERVRMDIEAALGIQLLRRSSGYLGGEYYLYQGTEAQRLTLRLNVDAATGEVEYREFESYPVLLFAEYPVRRDFERSLLKRAGARVLKRRHERARRSK
jgi:hypothetical protein